MKVPIMQLYASSVMFLHVVSSFSLYALRNWAVHLERGPQIHKYKEWVKLEFISTHRRLMKPHLSDWFGTKQKGSCKLNLLLVSNPE